MSLVGAGYLAALLSHDDELVAIYRVAFTGDELLDAIAEPIGLLSRYLGYNINKTTTEIGDALVRATQQKEASL